MGCPLDFKQLQGQLLLCVMKYLSHQMALAAHRRARGTRNRGNGAHGHAQRRARVRAPAATAHVQTAIRRQNKVLKASWESGPLLSGLKCLLNLPVPVTPA